MSCASSGRFTFHQRWRVSSTMKGGVLFHGSSCHQKSNLWTKINEFIKYEECAWNWSLMDAKRLFCANFLTYFHWWKNPWPIGRKSSKSKKSSVAIILPHIIGFEKSYFGQLRHKVQTLRVILSHKYWMVTEVVVLPYLTLYLVWAVSVKCPGIVLLPYIQDYCQGFAMRSAASPNKLYSAHVTQDSPPVWDTCRI